MKRTAIIFFLVLTTLPCRAQWVNAVFPAEVLAFGVHDTNLFVGSVPLGLTGPGSYLDSLVFRYQNGDWIALGAGIDRTQGNITSFASLGNYFFAGFNANGPIIKSSDDGNSWQGGIRADNPLLSNAGYLFAWADTTGEDVDAHIRRSSDSGRTWAAYGVLSLHVVAYGANGSCVLASAQEGFYRSTDSGGTWNPITTPISNITCFAVVGTVIYAANGTNVMVSTDSGAMWTKMNTSFGVSVLATNGTRLFAGGSGGVYLLDSGSTNWTAESDTGYLKGSTMVVALGVFDTLLFADFAFSDNTYQLWTRSIPQMTDSTPSGIVQAAQSGDTLSIYPNPASEAVNIISGGTSIYAVSVWDILGEDVLSVPRINEAELSIDVSKLQSGTYFFEIQTANGSVLRKLVIQR